MTPKEKALDLVRSFYEVYPVNGSEYGMEWGMAKQCALIAVNMEYDARISAYKELYEFCPDISAQASIYAEREREQLITEIQNL